LLQWFMANLMVYDSSNGVRLLEWFMINSLIYNDLNGLYD